MDSNCYWAGSESGSFCDSRYPLSSSHVLRQTQFQLIKLQLCRINITGSQDSKVLREGGEDVLLLNNRTFLAEFMNQSYNKVIIIMIMIKREKNGQQFLLGRIRSFCDSCIRVTRPLYPDWQPCLIESGSAYLSSCFYRNVLNLINHDR